MIVLTLEELAKAKHEADSLGLPMRAALLKECIDTNTFYWGEDPREATEKEAAFLLKQLRMPTSMNIGSDEPEMVILPN